MEPSERAREGKPGAILELVGITKLYPGSIALLGAHMDVERGEVHGIIGKNGAGKSTLVSIVSGITAPTDGRIRIGGEVYPALTRQRAKRLGVSIVTQEPEVIPDFTVAENLFFPDYLRTPDGRIRWGDMGREAERVMGNARLGVNVHAKMSDLSLSEQQLVLVAKAFFLEKARIIVLDEVTASLSSRDGAYLYEIIAAQKREGKSILFISHHMGEILEICDRVTVLRDGRTVATEVRGALDTHRLSRFIVGDGGKEGEVGEGEVGVGDEEIGPAGAGPAPTARDAGRAAPRRSPCGERVEPLLEVKGLTRAGVFYDVSFSLRPGEILGIAGLRGSGRTEVLKAIAGIERVDGGTVNLEGVEASLRSPSEAFARGVVYLPENRDKEGLIETQSVRVNLSLASLKLYTRGALISGRRERAAVARLIEALSIVTPSQEQEVRNLSGGNRQKVVVGKIFASKPLVYLLDEPTRGIDISAKRSILDTIRTRLAADSGVVMTSPGLEDLLAVCDRIVVLYGGRIADEFARGEFSERELYLAIHGMERRAGLGARGAAGRGPEREE